MSEPAERSRTELLAWFDREKRALPWRGTRDPYRILVSEVMLQQTRVETVIPYFERFLERFPTPEALADAEIDEVLALWSGLGYYGRARRLHGAARALRVSGFEWPRSAEALEKLPGIGPYTAAAVASIAFDEVVPVLDGNAIRVLSRVTGEQEDPRRAPVRRRLLEAGRSLLDRARPGDSNQALMELGATICAPKRPRCAACPLESGCLAAASGEPESYPPPRQRRKEERRRLLAAVVEEEGRFLLCRRSEDSEILAGTWEVPWVSWSGEAAAKRDLARKYGGRWTLSERIGEVRHAITYRRLEVEVRRAYRRNGGTGVMDEEWLAPGQLETVALSSLVRKVLGVATGGPTGSRGPGTTG